MYITIIGVFYSHSLSVDSIKCYTLCKKPFVTLQKEDFAAPSHVTTPRSYQTLWNTNPCVFFGVCHWIVSSLSGRGWGVTVGGWRDAKININPAVTAASAVTCLVSNGPWLNRGKRLGERWWRCVCRDWCRQRAGISGRLLDSGQLGGGGKVEAGGRGGGSSANARHLSRH